MSRNNFLRWMIYVIELVLLYLIQSTPGLIPEIFGARPVPVSYTHLAIADSFVAASNGSFQVTVDGDLFKATVRLPLAEEAPPAV